MRNWRIENLYPRMVKPSFYSSHSIHACMISFLSRAFAKLDSKKLEPEPLHVLNVKFWLEEKRLAVLLTSNCFACLKRSEILFTESWSIRLNQEPG